MKQWIAAVVLSSVAWSSLSRAESPVATPPAVERKTAFVRFIEDRHGGGMLETAETLYRRKSDGAAVTLIGAVHIADEAYFRGLDASFEQYDVLLYEMVKPRDAQPGAPDAETKRSRSGMLGWVGPMQQFMKDNLDLAYQMDGIRYDDRPNFVHADLDAETFMELQEERNEGFMKLFIRAYKSEYKRQKAGTSTAAQVTPFHLLAALKAGDDRPRKLKMLFARQLGDIEGQMEALEGPNGSVIITERNKRCMEVLTQQLDKGHRNIGVFYGAGHFPDMEERLVAMGFEPVGQTWRTAWDLDPPPATQPAR